VPQHIALYMELSAERNLRSSANCTPEGAALKERVGHALETVQLADRRHDVVKTFSAGCSAG